MSGRHVISFPIEGRRFNFRVAGIIIVDGHVLVCREDDDDYTMLPGGRIEWGETLQEAALRELAEETSVEAEIRMLLDSVDVNARCAPMTSLLSRETSAPVWVRVKKARDIRCTCAKTVVRRSKIRPSPMREDRNPWPTASTALATATPAMTHSAIQEALNGSPVTWMEKVSDEDYGAGPSAG